MTKSSKAGHWIYRKYIVKNGKRIYPVKAKCLRIWVKSSKPKK